MLIKVKYDGAWPNLCSGNLTILIDDTSWEFPAYCLSSGGSCGFRDSWSNEYVEEGDWSIREWPKDFPESLKSVVEDAVNSQIPLGCCGGCL